MNRYEEQQIYLMDEWECFDACPPKIKEFIREHRASAKEALLYIHVDKKLADEVLMIWAHHLKEVEKDYYDELATMKLKF